MYEKVSPSYDCFSRHLVEKSRSALALGQFPNDLKTLGKMKTEENFPELAEQVQKIGMNQLISRKTVTFSFSPNYEFIPSLLASARVATSSTSSPQGDKNGGSTKWCAREDLNLHPLRDQILSLACLPFHHSRNLDYKQLTH